jgi:hypothetical protein
MPTQLKIKWEGTAPGLADRRLSISAFGESLTILLAALRRIAGNVVGEAIGEKKSGTGRFTNEARQLDIEIFDLVRESSGFDSLISITPPADDTLPLFGDLAEFAGTSLLDAIDLERRGTARNHRVRSYLQSLPRGITKQTYQLHSNGTVIKEVSFSSVDLPLLPSDLPYLCEYTGKIVGVGFEPGRAEVRIKTEDSHAILAATPKQVEAALELRHSQVHVLAVCYGDNRRLLILREVGLPIYRPTQQEGIFKRWASLLERLAQ